MKLAFRNLENVFFGAIHYVLVKVHDFLCLVLNALNAVLYLSSSSRPSLCNKQYAGSASNDFLQNSRLNFLTPGLSLR